MTFLLFLALSSLRVIRVIRGYAAHSFISNTSLIVNALSKSYTSRKSSRLSSSVFRMKPASSVFLDAMKKKIATQASRDLNPDLYRFYREWQAHLDARRDVTLYYDLLASFSKRFLHLDLSDPWNQIEYPQMVRFFALRRLEKNGTEVLERQSEREKEALLVWLRDFAASADVPSNRKATR